MRLIVPVHVPCAWVARRVTVCPSRQEVFRFGRLSVVYRGRKLRDDETPSELHLANETLLHVVAEQASGPTCGEGTLLTLPGCTLQFNTAAVVPVEVRANCRCCDTPGARFEMRPVCHTCG